MTTIVALGDSIAFGVGDVRAAGLGPGWSGRLATAIGGAHHQRLAWPGARLSEMAKSQVGATVIARPDIALVSIGGNDAIRRNFDAQQFCAELRDSLITLQAAANTVVVTTLADISRTAQIPKTLRPHLRQRVDLLNGAIVHAARDSKVCVLDRWNDEDAYLEIHLASDRVHPSSRGYQSLAEQTAKLLSLAVLHSPAPPSLGQTHSGWWLAAHGVPWALKRSVRLVPTVVSMLRNESTSSFSNELRRIGHPEGHHGQADGQDCQSRDIDLLASHDQPPGLGISEDQAQEEREGDKGRQHDRTASERDEGHHNQ